MNRASAGAYGNSGRSGAICSEILPFSVDRERFTESFRISFVCSFFHRSRSFCARPSITQTFVRYQSQAATRPARNAMQVRRVSVSVTGIFQRARIMKEWCGE